MELSVVVLNAINRGCKTCMHTLQFQDEMDCDPKVWRDVAKERILRSADAALIVLHITTAPNMPKNVHLEESIEQIITLTKYHLETNIYPQFDPVYRAENKGTCVFCRRLDHWRHICYQ